MLDDGNLIKLQDDAFHRPAPIPESAGGLLEAQEWDRRWVRIQRPTVVVGGELVMDNLEVRHDPRSNICEAPLQMKSNCGCLLIDDFGRQRIGRSLRRCHPRDLLTQVANYCKYRKIPLTLRPDRLDSAPPIHPAIA